MSKNLRGKVALVTGGSRGIGEAIALRLAQDGADVAINYQYTQSQANKVAKEVNRIGTEDEFEILETMIDQMNTKENAEEIADHIDRMGNHSMTFQANVNDYEEVNAMAKAVEKELGPVDILVNNAGIVRDKSFMKMTPEIWSEVLSVNLDGAFYCAKAVIGGMVERGFGRIVNMSSVIGRTGNRGQANYAASKAGMIALTQTLAKEFAGKGITINAVAPGFTETDMVKGVPSEIMEKVIRQIPLGRLGKPSEVAGAVSYLVSEDGNYITGQVIDINGGMYI